jgi:hypothetical protein
MTPSMTPAQDLPSMPSQEAKDITQRIAHLRALLDAAASHEIKPLWFEYRDLRDQLKVPKAR